MAIAPAQIKEAPHSAPANRTKPQTDQPTIMQAMQLLRQPGEVVELRAIDAIIPQDRRPHTESGYFDFEHLDEMAKAAANIQSAKAIYYTLNPVKPALLSRAFNRSRNPGKDPTTADHDIERRCWLLVDGDGERPAGISATDAEHEASIERVRLIRDHLVADGWPDPILADSGNGAHLLYRIDLPTDDGGLVQRCLEALDFQFSADDFHVDTTVFNPARINKLYGTVARKGDDTPDRPHRLSKILEIPETIVVVPKDLLEALAAKAPKDEAPAYQPSGNGDRYARFDLREWIARHGLDVEAEQAWQGSGRKWMFRVCPFNADHTDRSAIVAQRPAGQMIFNCSHNSCSGRGWHDLRDLIEPGWRDRKASYQGNGHAERSGHQAAGSTRQAKERAPKFVGISCGELASLKYRPEWRIKGILTAGEPFLIAGAKKSLKTSIVVDLSLALATGEPFLGKFAIERPCNVLLLSGESGLPTLAETALRVSDRMQIDLATVERLTVFDRVPSFGDDGDADELRQVIGDRQADVVIVDPTYLAMSGADAGNLFIQGSMLREIAELCQGAGAQLGLVHHTRKNVADPHQPPELEDVAWAGFQEWARQWLLLSRREKYEPGTGNHQLWMVGGGSAGHSSKWALDVREGVNQGEGGRFWDVDVLASEEARQTGNARKEAARERERADGEERAIERAMREIVQAARKFPSGETAAEIRSKAGLDGKRPTKLAFSRLEDDGTLERCEVVKAGRNWPAFRIAKQASGESGEDL